MVALTEVTADELSADWLDAVFARFCIGREPARYGAPRRARRSTARRSRSWLVSSE